MKPQPVQRQQHRPHHPRSQFKPLTKQLTLQIHHQMTQRMSKQTEKKPVEKHVQNNRIKRMRTPNRRPNDYGRVPQQLHQIINRT